MKDERYDRQLGLFGKEGQEKLSKAKISVIGYNLLSEFTIAALASLGIGNIFLISNEQNKKHFIKSKNLKKFFYKFNRDINFYPIHSNITTENSTVLLPPSDVTIDTTQDPISKYYCAKFCKDKNKNALLGYSTNEKGVLLHSKTISNLEKIISSFNKSSEDIASSEIIAGLIADETRKILLPRQNEIKRNYNLDFENYKLKKGNILMVGAGAIGNWLGIGLALMGLDAKIIDDDIIEITNLNRQFLYYNSIGKRKAKTLAKKLSAININKKKFDYSYSRFIESSLDVEANYDLIVSCVDNQKTRFLMNEFAYKEKIPLVNGGTDPFSGEVGIYIPKKNSCLCCQNGLNNFKEEPKQKSANSCIRQKENSIVISNLVIAGLMLEKIKGFFSGRLDGTEKIIYSSENGFSTMNISARKDCKCYNDH